MLPDSLSIDDSEPLPLRRPATVAELGDLVKDAAGSGRGIYPVGGRTMLDVGLPPSKPGFAVDTTALNAVIDYPARDMTVTVQAGITVAKLQETLAAEGQWLPIDVPQPERATIGGAVALNVSGPRRLGYGTLRDYVIGISFVTDEGREVKAGGRVVKNVAGYDLMKAQIGAAGTLGVVTQLTLKVKPKPETMAVVKMHCAAAELQRVLDRLHESKSRPVAVDAVSDGSVVGAAWAVWVGFAEKAATVEWQVSTLLDELRHAPVTDVTVERGADAESRLRTLTESTRRLANSREPTFGFKANVRPSETARFCNGAGDIPGIRVHAHALNGIVYGHTIMDVSQEAATAAVNLLGDAADGNFAVTRCPPAWKKSLPVWGTPGGDRELMRHLKRTLDPGSVFNPGRLFGDL